MLNITTIIYFFLIIIVISVILYIMGVFTPNVSLQAEKFGSNYTRADVKIFLKTPNVNYMSEQQKVIYQKYNELLSKFNNLNEFKGQAELLSDNNIFEIQYKINNITYYIGQPGINLVIVPQYDFIVDFIDEKISNLNNS